MIRVLGHFFTDPLGNSRKDVYCELELESNVIRPADGTEPADVDWRVRRLSLNNFDTFEPFRGRFAAVTRYMLEHAQ